MDKKGVEITFNWIFVIIAGSVLLMFFIYFAWQQIGLFNEIGIKEITNNINNEIDAFSIGISSNKIVELPKDISFSFKCGEVVYKTESKDTLHLVYSNGKLKDKFNLWTNAWIFPFKIDNLYYASELNKRFIILGDDGFAFNLPEKFQKLNSLNQDVRKDDVIVDFTKGNYNFRFKDNKVLAVDKEKSLVTFYPENKKEEFYSEAMIYGAMFSDYEEYTCLKKKALERLGIMSELYKKKANLLKLNSKCNFLYGEMDKTLDLFKKEPLRYKKIIEEQNDNIKRGGCISVF